MLLLVKKNATGFTRLPGTPPSWAEDRMARDMEYDRSRDASSSEGRGLPPLSPMSLTENQTELAREDLESPAGDTSALRPPTRSLYSPRGEHPINPRPSLLSDTRSIKDSLDETVHGLKGFPATAGNGKNGGGQDTTFLVSTCLPNSVYLWACGEGTPSSEGSAGDEECSASDMVVGWLTLASQILAYSVLIWNRSGGQDADSGLQVFFDSYEATDSSNSSDSSEDICPTVSGCNVTASLGTQDDSKDYSIISVAVAMFLVVSTSSPDVRVAYSLLMWGRSCTHSTFGFFLLLASGLLVFASMVVLFDKAADNTDLVIGAAAILFVAETDEKIMEFLTAIPRKWRLFWMLETIGVSFALAMIGVDYFGDGTAVMPKDESGESVNPHEDNLVDVMYTSEKNCPAAMRRNFSFGMAMFYYDRLEDNDGGSVYPLDVSLLLTPVVMTFVSFWCNSFVEVMSAARRDRLSLVSRGRRRWILDAVWSSFRADMAYALVLVAWYLHGAFALLAYGLHFLYPVLWLLLFTGPGFFVLGIAGRLCCCLCGWRRRNSSATRSRWPSLAIGWGGGYMMAAIFFWLKVHMSSYSLLSVAFMLVLTLIFALTLADVEMWGRTIAGSGIASTVVQYLKNDACVIHWTIMSALQYFSLMWAMFMMDMIFTCMLK